MFGLTLEKLAIIGVIAVLIVGPQRLPAYATSLARLTRAARGWLRDTRRRLGEELGPEFDDVDWAKLDPRQYDPRRIIRDALLEPDASETASGSRTARGANSDDRETSPRTSHETEQS